MMRRGVPFVTDNGEEDSIKFSTVVLNRDGILRVES